MGFPPASVTLTAGGVATAAPAEAVWPSPATFASFAGAAVNAEALNVTLRFAGAPFPVARAMTRWFPATGPSDHWAPAFPSAPVVVEAGDTRPPPAATANSTG